MKLISILLIFIVLTNELKAQTINNQRFTYDYLSKYEPNYFPDTRVLKYDFGQNKVLHYFTGEQLISRGQSYTTPISHYGSKHFNLDSLIIPDSTLLFISGFVVGKSLIDQKELIFSAFQIDNMPLVGDTAIFNFCFIQTNYSPYFLPEINFCTNKQIVYEGKYLKPKKIQQLGSFDVQDVGYGLVKATAKIPITRQNQKYDWILLVNRELVYGYVASLDLLKYNENIKQLNQGYFTAQFDINSELLNKYDQEKIKFLSAKITEQKTVEISVEIGNSGNLTYQRCLALKRMEEIYNHFITSGINPESIKILPIKVNNTDDENTNRFVHVRITE